MKRKCILILVDGMRPDALPACGNPFCKDILKTGAVQITARTVMPSVTLPCHISLFHSVPPERHGTLTNDYVEQVRPVKSLFEVLHDAGKKTASVYNWEQLRDISRPGYLDFAYYLSQYAQKDSDSRITDTALCYLEKESPDFMFLYLGETDEAGHKDGWMSPFYLKTLSGAWDCIQRVADATQGEYDLLLVADHGGHGRCHGTDMPEDMTIPIFLRPVGGEKIDTENVDIMDLSPTIARIMGLAPDRDWEGHSLLK